MLLSKLKLVSGLMLAVAVGVGAVGLTYRPAAAQPAARNDPARSARATPDELEELRLEVAALRKGLEVTRERVKVLEHRVETLAAGRHGANDTTGGVRLQNLLPQGQKPADPGTAQGAGKQPDLPQDSTPADVGRDGSKGSNRLPHASQHLRVYLRNSFDPFGTAQAALKQLRANPNDKEAADVLERALWELKDQQDLRRTHPRQQDGQNQTTQQPQGHGQQQTTPQAQPSNQRQTRPDAQRNGQPQHSPDPRHNRQE